jgi:diguanylate cyclase (GGDEF)-like protein
MAGTGAPGAVEPGARIRPIAGEFADPRIEAEFWQDAAEVTASAGRRAGLIIAVGYLCFSLPDLLAVGFGARWSVLLGVRVLTVGPLLALVGRLDRDPQAIRDHSRLTIVQAVLLGGYQVVALLQPDAAGAQTASMVLVITTLFVLVPNRLLATTLLGVVGGAMWLVVSAVGAGSSVAEVVSQASIVAATIVVGFVGANRLATTSRREYVLRLRERSINERLSVEVAWRQRMEHDLVRRANIDDLTGVANRRWFHELAEQELRRAQRHDHPLAVLVLDVDHFKDVNDTHGHFAGDQVLVELGRVLNDQVRRVDVLGRIGGEEFAVVMPGASIERAAEAAERLRAAVADLRFRFDGVEVSASMSIGLTTCDVWTERISEAIERADQALYQAKAAGRNCVVAVPCPSHELLRDETR